MNKKSFSDTVSLGDVKVMNGFWKEEMELVRKEVIPYQWNALNDKVEDAEPSYCMRNFKLAGKVTEARKHHEYNEDNKYPVGIVYFPDKDKYKEERFFGWAFQDSDFAKWIEAVAYSLRQHPDNKLEEIADGAIDIVCAAQQENGYLDTMYIINDMSKTFTDLRNLHELYCFGHMTEGAVAYYQSTGKDKFLKAIMRYADYIISRFGDEEGKIKGYPGHEIAEMALVRLFEVTDDKRYLKLASFFIDERGRKPYYFDMEQSRLEASEDDDEQWSKYTYYQAHKPVREQQEAVGHAVRAVYLYSGMADMARYTDDDELYKACRRLWKDIVYKKMYITGGIGGTHMGEAFSYAYDLQNDTAYAETCASIGLVFFAQRMLKIKPDSQYADMIERALYNGILSGMAFDGKSFFYVNSLQVLPEACHKDDRIGHVKPVRQKWFGCACCPPNLARLISSIGSYIYTRQEDTLFVHQYISSQYNGSADGGHITINMDSAMPWNGKISVDVSCDFDEPFIIAFRKPEWCYGYNLAHKIVSDKSMANTDVWEKDGYIYIKKVWSEDTITWEFPMEARIVRANLRVREDISKVALMRGPVVYCLEEKDNGGSLWNLNMTVHDNNQLKREAKIEEISIADRNVYAVRVLGVREVINSCDADMEEPLYKDYSENTYDDVELTFVPYYAWANRGEGEMSVWVHKL